MEDVCIWCPSFSFLTPFSPSQQTTSLCSIPIRGPCPPGVPRPSVPDSGGHEASSRSSSRSQKAAYWPRELGPPTWSPEGECACALAPAHQVVMQTTLAECKVLGIQPALTQRSPCGNAVQEAIECQSGALFWTWGIIWAWLSLPFLQESEQRDTAKCKFDNQTPCWGSWTA